VSASWRSARGGAARGGASVFVAMWARWRVRALVHGIDDGVGGLGLVALGAGAASAR